MNNKTKQALLQRAAMLKILLQWHSENKDKAWDSTHKYNEFINAALDELIEIQELLNNEKHKP